MKLFGAKLIVPESNETKEIDVVQTWEVRWLSVETDPRYRLADYEPQIEVFPSRKDAEDFATSLRKAWQLARIWGLDVSVEQRPLIR